MQIKWTSPAQTDLYQAFEYITQENPSAALSVIDRIEEGVNNLAKYPEIGRRGRVAQTRELIVPRTPYIVSYRVKSNQVDILAIIHSSRRWPDNF